MKVRLKGSKNVFEDLAEQYKNYILLGVLKQGEKLPSCRELAIELGINPNTVEKSYSELEKEGLVIKIPKKGVYVNEILNQRNSIISEAEQQIYSLKNAGITQDELTKILNKVYKEGKNND